ncbi:MAG: hypothetical protein ACRDAX_04980 [Propionibacteriaceae bacterium]
MRYNLFKTSVIGSLSLAISLTLSPMAPAQATEGTYTTTVNCSTLGVANTSGMVKLTYKEIAAAKQMIDSGLIDKSIVVALEGVRIDYEIIGPSPRALPVVATVAVAAVAWCAKGALGSLPASALQDIANRANNDIPPPDYVMNAIFACAGGPVLGVLTSQWMRVRFAGAVIGLILKIRR